MYLESGINKETDELLMKPIPYIPVDKEKMDKLDNIYLLLNRYTMKRDKFFLPFAERNLFKNFFEHINEYDYFIDDEFGFRFCLLSDRIEGNKKMIKQLKSKERFHVCHEASIGMCLNDAEDNLSILIGYVPCTDTEVLHSVIELEEGEKKYIIDFTQNIVMTKEKYIVINSFRELNKVTSKKLKEDCKIMEEFGIRTPFYLLFRDELMKDLNKNSKVLTLEN